MPIFEIQHQDKTFEVDAPDMATATNVFGAYNTIGGMFGGGAAPAGAPPAAGGAAPAGAPPAAPAPAAQPYSAGPLSDLGELGARGINAGVQGVGRMTGMDVGPPRQPQPLGAPINLPGIGQPSVIGTGKALLNTAASGATLPGDVYAGRVDPLSDQGIGRATDLAALTPLGAMPSAVVRAPAAPLAAPQIKVAATVEMDAIRDASRAIPLQPGALDSFAQTVAAHVNQNGPSWKTAQKAHQAIEDMGKTARQGDLGDLIDSRQALMDIVRTGRGQDIRAAKMAVDKIDSTLEPVNPGLVARIKEADKNYAIALAASKQEKGIAAAIREAGNAGTGGNIGNKIRQAVEKDLKKGLEKGRLSPEVQAAMENVTQPGRMVNALRPLTAFDPTHSKLGAMYSALPHIGAGVLTGGKSLALSGAGYGARAMYDRIMKQRAAKISEAMRAQSPAAMAGPPFPRMYGSVPSDRPGGIFPGRQAPALAQPGILNLGVMPPRDQY